MTAAQVDPRHRAGEALRRPGRRARRPTRSRPTRPASRPRPTPSTNASRRWPARRSWRPSTARCAAVNLTVGEQLSSSGTGGTTHRVRQRLGPVVVDARLGSSTGGFGGNGTNNSSSSIRRQPADPGREQGPVHGVAAGRQHRHRHVAVGQPATLTGHHRDATRRASAAVRRPAVRRRGRRRRDGGTGGGTGTGGAGGAGGGAAQAATGATGAATATGHRDRR